MIWVAQYRGPHISLSYGARIGFDAEVAGHVIPIDAHSASISLGQFVFQTLTVRPPSDFNGGLEFQMLERWGARTEQLWPVRNLTIWPPSTPIIDEAEFNDFIGRFKVGPDVITS